MTGSASLDDRQIAIVAATADVLLADSVECPSPGSLPEFRDLVDQAARALGPEVQALDDAIAGLPAELNEVGLAAYSTAEPEAFELLAQVVVGAYFMSPTVRAAIKVPSDRRPAPRDQAVDELTSGILDAVLDRGSPVKTLQEVDEMNLDHR